LASGGADFKKAGLNTRPGGTPVSNWNILVAMRVEREDVEGVEEGASAAIDELVAFYRKEVIPHPHRRVNLPGRRCRAPRIITTLLGFELQIRDTRISCPDLATAEYLKIFARIGAPELLMPINPTITADILDEMTRIWEKFDAACRKMEAGGQKSKAGRLRGKLKAKIETETLNPQHS